MHHEKNYTCHSFAFCALSLAVSCGCPAENTKSLLWKISGNGLEQPSYLFGTWHGDTELRGGSFLDSVPHFYRAFDAAQAYVGEKVVVRPDTNARNYRKSIVEAMLLPQDTTYSDLLDAGRLALLDSLLLRSFGATSQGLRVSPAAMLSICAETMLLDTVEAKVQRKLADLASRRGEMEDSLYFKQRTRILAEKDVMDVYLQKYALQQGKELMGLDQIAGCDLSVVYRSPQSHPEAAEALIDFLSASGKKKKDYVDGLRAAYRSQDIAEIYRAKQEQMQRLNEGDSEKASSQNEMITAILPDRNVKWMEVLPGIMQEQSAFVAVGGGHLGGPDGLIDLLRRAGYTVEPVL